MNQRIDHFLLGILWLCASVLAATFWFNVRFGFNLFKSSHWQYFSQIQVSSVPVTPSFYISIILTAVISLGGLYLIIRPRFRKIRPHHKTPAPATDKTDNVPQETAQPPVESEKPNMSRPPSIIMPSNIMNNYQTSTASSPKQSAQPQANEVNRFQTPDIDKQLADIIESAGYRIKNPPKIGRRRPSAFALGMDELLLVGIAVKAFGDITAGETLDAKWRDSAGEFESPVWAVNTMADRLRALFTETLDPEIKITVLPFVVIEGGEISNLEQILPLLDSLGVGVFIGLNSFDNYMKGHNNRTMNDIEKEDFEAYSEYMDTVADYFNNEI